MTVHRGDEDERPRARSGDPLALARALVRTPSVNPALERGGTGEADVAGLAAGWLDAWGFSTRIDEIAPGRCNVVARHGGGRGPTLLLNGHLDTVGVGGMSVDPFAARVEDGRLFGRGACDMKGGVASLLAAARELAKAGDAGTLLVGLTADEEHAATGMQALVADAPAIDQAVVCEPTALAVMPAHKGFSWLRVRFEGRAAHGSRPEEGIDAIRHAGLFLSALDTLVSRLEEREPHPLLGHGSLHAGIIEGGTAPSVYPDTCELTLERRTLPGENRDDVEREVRNVLEALAREHPTVSASVETTLFRGGSDVAPSHALVTGLLDACAGVGREPRVEGMTAWVDASFLNDAGIPAVCFGPGSIAKAHSADEWAPVDEIEACATILERFGRSYLGR